MISDTDLEKFRGLIYKITGMLFDEKKNYYISSRIEQRLQDTQKTLSEYYQDLMFGTAKEELQRFVELITINETYFFRDFPQLQGFAEKIFPPYLQEKARRKDNVLKIWSAACSTGEEAYTLAIILKEMVDGHGEWNIQIDATDIDTKVLDHAKKGTYSDRSMKDTPLVYRQKYFDVNNGQFHVRPSLKNVVRFQRVNFMDKQEMSRMHNYDFIFCRNVLIYFDDESRKKVVEDLFKSLGSGGHLFLGHSESIGRITNIFETQTVDKFVSYRKPRKA